MADCVRTACLGCLTADIRIRVQAIKQMKSSPGVPPNPDYDEIIINPTIGTVQTTPYSTVLHFDEYCTLVQQYTVLVSRRNEMTWEPHQQKVGAGGAGKVGNIILHR